MAGDDDSNRSRDSTDVVSPPEKKPKIETETDAKAEEDSDSEPDTVIETTIVHKGRVIRLGKLDDPEYVRQRNRFCQQFIDTEGFDLDWDSYDYLFNVLNFDWNPDLDVKLTKWEVLQLLIGRAIEEYDDEHGTKLKYEKYVSANILNCKGRLFHITFWATDLNLPHQKPKLYQAQVQRYCDEITVIWVRLKPTQ